MMRPDGTHLDYVLQSTLEAVSVSKRLIEHGRMRLESAQAHVTTIRKSHAAVARATEQLKQQVRG